MYKNWKEICQIPDTHVMWALALLDMDSDLGRSFMERFPEYFTQDEQEGPIPLSILRAEAHKKAEEDGHPEYYDELVSDEACERFGIPVQGFRGPEDSYKDGRIPLPVELAHLVDARGIGQVVEWGGKKFVVVENRMPECIYVAPADRIAFDR